MFMCQTTGLLLLIMPLLIQDKRSLPFKTYIPYSTTTLLPYVLTYLQQSIGLIYRILLNVSLDSIVYGFIIHTCGQIELLCYRLRKIFQFLQNNTEKNANAIESFAIAECVKHHILVYDIMYRIQSLFMWNVAALFFFSLINLCTNIYQMSKVKNSLSYIFFVNIKINI